MKMRKPLAGENNKTSRVKCNLPSSTNNAAIEKAAMKLDSIAM